MQAHNYELFSFSSAGRVPLLSNKVSGIASEYCLWHLPCSGSRCLQGDGKRVSKSSPTCNIRKSDGCQNATQSTKMLWIWGVLKQRNSIAASFEQRRGFGCLRYTEIPGFLEDERGFCSCLTSQVLPKSSFSTYQGCLCSQWVGFLEKTPQLSSLYFRWLYGQAYLSIQPSDCSFAVLISLWLVCAPEMGH